MNKDHTSNTAQAMWIGIGSLFSFLFAIVSTAILARYLDRGEYGTYRQVMYVYSTLLTVFTLGLPLAYSYFLPRVDLHEGKSLVNKLNICFIILGIVFSSVLYIGANVIATILNNPQLSLCIKIFSPAPMLILPTMGLQGILATYRMTKLNATYVVITRIIMLTFVALPVIFIRSSVEYALWGFNIASILSLIVALIIMNIPFKNINKHKCQISYKEIFNYSLPLMLSGFFGIAISASDQFYVSRYFGREVFADFANGAIELPIVGMVLNAGSVVLLPLFSKMISSNVNNENIISLWDRTAIKSATLIYPMVCFCIFFASEIMVLIYGQQYITSAVYFRIMNTASFFIVIQFYPLILAIGKTKAYALVHFWVCILVWGLEFVIAKYLNSAPFITVISVICKIIKILLIMKIVADSINVYIWDLFPIRKLLTVLTISMFSCLISYEIVRIIPFINNEAICILSGLVIYIPLLLMIGYFFHIDFLNTIRPLISNKKHDAS